MADTAGKLRYDRNLKPRAIFRLPGDSRTVCARARPVERPTPGVAFGSPIVLRSRCKVT